MPTDSLSTVQADALKPGLSGMFAPEIAEALHIEAYRARQIFQWIHAKQIFDFEEMTNLPKDLRRTLSEQFRACGLTLVKNDVSRSSETSKVVLALSDGETVEAVYIPARDRETLCLSTQVGCAVKCSFCATGLSGFARNLNAGEIVEQALYLLAERDLAGRSPNIVFMGMGEPFRNYDETMRSIHLLMEKDGLNVGARRITVSTAGEIDGILRFSEEDWQVRLSVSLHAANDTLRSKLVPLNRRYDLRQLRDAVHTYTKRTGRQMTFEWTLISGVNDSPRDADELARFVGETKAIVNLIPYNPVAGIGYKPPPPGACIAFKDKLHRLGVRTTLRRERGQDIDAACGQLRRSVLKD